MKTYRPFISVSSRLSRRYGRALAAALLAVPLIGLTPTISSAQQATAYHPETDTLGSTIAAHEPVRKGHYSPHVAAGSVPGVDVSNHQGTIDWPAVAGANRFAYMKATEGTNYVDATFAANYNGSYAAGMLRGAYHFATPDTSTGAVQAQYFVSHGGGWSKDGKTLPPMLDIEYNPYGDKCYGMNPAAMSQWIADFSNEVQRLTSRFPVIYSTTDWWNTCTGSNPGFAGANPLFVAHYASDVGALPAGWGVYTIWQYSSTGSVPGINGNVDVDTFNGDEGQLTALANG